MLVATCTTALVLISVWALLANVLHFSYPSSSPKHSHSSSNIDLQATRGVGNIENTTSIDFLISMDLSQFLFLQRAQHSGSNLNPMPEERLRR